MRANIEAVPDFDSGTTNTREIVDFISREADIFFAIMVSTRMDLALAATTLHQFGLNDEQGKKRKRTRDGRVLY
jgi:hypothetical protein